MTTEQDPNLEREPNTDDPPVNQQNDNQHHYKPPNIIFFFAGLLLVLIPIALAIFAPEAFVNAGFFLRVIAAIGAGLVGIFIPGTLHVKFPGAQATGAMAMFAAVFFTNPGDHVVGSSYPVSAPKTNNVNVASTKESQALNFNACQNFTIYNSQGFRGNSSIRVSGGRLNLSSARGGLVQLVNTCSIELKDKSKEFDIHLGPTTVTYVTSNPIGAQGNGLSVRFACEKIRLRNPSWGSWANGRFVGEQSLAPNPRVSATKTFQKFTYRIQCPNETKQLTAVIALSDPWKDTEMVVQLDNVVVTPL